MISSRLQELEKAGYFYNSIATTENDFRRKLGVVWKLHLFKKLASFKEYSAKDKLEVVKGLDRKNRFLESVFDNKYILLGDYYNKWLKQDIFASANTVIEKEEIRCLFYLLDEIFRQDCYKIQALIDNKDIVIDIGANIGIFTTAVQEYYPNTKIMAFEPASDTCATLKKNVKKYKNVTVYNLGLGEKNEIKQLRITAKNIANRIDDRVDSEMKVESLRNERIKVVKLDNYIKDQADVIKLDIEGYEEFALMGGEKFIQKHKPLIICVNEHSKSQKANLIKRMRKISPDYKSCAISEVATCFYVNKKHAKRIARLKNSS